ncbi:MAG TPA: hypothetical protein PLJ37_01190 [Chitinophagales bacterium]|nr:hypothetical protein [Chitinophagales bacterium]HMW93441.1 hypothetical protein [Chitinophagales bacterium]HMZ92936.1 hypothetical protein [Chitinophagales bacterium]HNG26000.1 hypothetical protein [Chitinophagales bacterium]
MANQPVVNRSSFVLIKKATPGTLLTGYGVVFSGGYSVDGFMLADYSSMPDGLTSGVIYETEPTDTTVGFMCPVGMSNIKLKIGAAGVSAGDKLDIQDSTGVWKKASVDAARVYFVALESANAGDLCWATPIAGYVIPPTGVVNKILQIASAKVSSDQSTASASLVDLPGTSVTITTVAGSKIKLDSSFAFSNTSALGSTTNIVLDIDGSTDTGAGQTTPGLTGAVQAGSINRLITGLSAGSHTFKLKWGTTAGSTRCRPVSVPTAEHASIVVMEIGS